MKYQTSFSFCRNACTQLLNWEDIEIVWRWNIRLWSSQLSFLIILQSYPGLQEMGEQEDCLILANSAFGRKAPQIVHLECSDLFFMLPEIRRELFNGPNGLTQSYMQRLWDNSPQYNAPRARCIFWAVIPGPACFQKSTSCICIPFILIFDCISLLILSGLSMYYPPVKTSIGANYEVFFFSYHSCAESYWHQHNSYTPLWIHLLAVSYD